MKRLTCGARLNLQALESRLVPSVSVTNGALRIEGTAKADSVVVYKLTDRYLGQIFVVYESIKGQPRSKPEKVLLDGIGRIEFYGRAGNDSFNFSDITRTSDYVIQAYGGKGNDTLVGASKDDLLMGEEGYDVLMGYAGNDTVIGGGGTDRIWGGKDNDHLYGNVEPDANPSGLDGMDIIYGEDGDDHLDGGQEGHRDLLTGGKGKDTFIADPRFDPKKPAINLDDPRDEEDSNVILLPSGEPWI